MEKTQHVFSGLTEIGLAREGRKWDSLREKINFEDVFFRKGVGEVTFIAPVVLRRWSDVPAYLTMGTEWSSGIGREVGDDFGACGGNGSTVEVEVPKEGSVGG